MLFSFTFSGFRISSANGGLVRNDGLKELRHSLSRGRVWAKVPLTCTSSECYKRPQRYAMQNKHNTILAAEEAFARQVALSVIVTTPQSAFHYIIPFMFVFDFLRRTATIRHYTRHFLFPRRLALDAAQDILGGEERTKRLSEIELQIKAWLNGLKLYSSAVQQKQMDVIHLLVEHYTKLLQVNGDTYNALVRNRYDNRQNYEAYLRRLAAAEEELDGAVMEELGEDEKLRRRMEAERRQVERLSEKRMDQIFQDMM